MNSSSEMNKNKNKSKNIFKNLKNDYFLRNVFNNLLEKRSLDIIKYNKYIKDRINISIKDYKEYSEIYSPIEIEIKPANNQFGNFININEENEKYYHIYFNNNKQEIKRNYLNENEKVEKLKIIIDYQVKSLKELFNNCGCIECIYFKKFYRNNINDMRLMFFGCFSLKELNVSNFNTNNVTNMEYMFSDCSSLTELNLSNFNTNNVTNMENIFEDCSSLTELNLSNFNTNNVINMRGMFIGCSSLKELNLPNFNTNKVTNMSGIFKGCYSLKELNLPNFNTNNVINIDGMFYGCSNQFQNKIRARYKNIEEEAFNDV